MGVGRYRDIEVADMPPALAAVLGVLLLALFCGLIWYLTRLDHTKLRDPSARARAERRRKSRRRQRELRTRRESLQRKAARDRDSA
ncbi:hypothetical protein ACIP29_02075 [Streptomyces coelicoflavus]|uniref:hypothetical protein n=1 Tax=Streptomyces coelicoflavus TaxID=285562 RepID=UPI000247674A|nr:hypothetical protein SMCF_721 [Streptomyces coelicoflavus ZG0656]KPC72397.1 hypothetical protein ADL35_31260 [Streptomyces sp. NRRL WC-3753]MZE44330.1 hypothetical protein [Streptomyces sp. SID5477]